MSKKKAAPEVITAYKGFDKNMQCRGYQFEAGQTYTHAGAVQACESGFHACEYPLDVLSYYPPTTSLYHAVTMAGVVSRKGDDTKVASAQITVGVELHMPELVSRAIEWVHSRLDRSTEAASNTGYQSAASNTGYQSAASNTGTRSAASNTGYQSAASNTGDYSAAEVSGAGAVATNVGAGGRARASIGGAIVLVCRADDGTIAHIRASKTGENGVEPDVWYTLDAAGEFVAWENK